VHLFGSAKQSIEPLSIQSGAEMLAEDYVHHDQRNTREEQRPRIRRRSESGEHPDRDRANGLEHAETEPIAEVLPVREPLTGRHDESDETLRDHRHHERRDDRAQDTPRRDVSRRALIDEDENRQAANHREHDLPQVEGGFDERTTSQQEAGRRADEKHEQDSAGWQKQSPDDEIQLIQLQGVRLFVAQEAERERPTDRHRHSEREDDERISPAIVGGEPESSDRRNEPGDDGAGDDGSRGAVHGPSRGAQTQSGTPPPIVEVATSTSGHEHAWRACVLSARTASV
jgi:hypothetical protein